MAVSLDKDVAWLDVSMQNEILMKESNGSTLDATDQSYKKQKTKKFNLQAPQCKCERHTQRNGHRV
jgi:hypothetical protein